ncbi:hypothetical protein OAO01_05400 [Oligoflexia bacterium]|nr:hypothetical protein [Oligoflexia bacterium]
MNDNVSAQTDAVDAVAADPEVRSHFWVCSFPFFETTLFILPPVCSEESSCTSTFESLVSFFDADGSLINEVSVVVPKAEIGVLEVDQCMGSCKLEGGLKHGHIVVTSAPGSKHFCRMHTGEGAALLGEPTVLQKEQSNFFPLTFSEEKSSFLCVVNHGEEEAHLKCRLFLGKRTPDFSCSVPAFGSRVFNVESEFSEYTDISEGQLIQAYLRLSSRGSQPVGVLLVERTDNEKDKGIFTSVT